MTANTIERILSDLGRDTYQRTYAATGSLIVAKRNAKRDVRQVCHALRRQAELAIEECDEEMARQYVAAARGGAG